MNPPAGRIEIFAPFGEAFDLTKKILFQPFDLPKWFVIGFAAWLATFFRFNFSYRRNITHGDWRWQTFRSGGNAPNLHHLAPWVIPLVIFGGLFLLALLVLFTWLNARGRFVFTDCIVRNRGAIVAPWREYHLEGNRYFVFELVVMLCHLAVVLVLLVLFFTGAYNAPSVFPIALGVIFVVAYILLAIIVSLVLCFMVPVMYRQRCGALDACRQVLALMSENVGVFLLFFLFYIVLCLAGAMIGCLAGCITCCIAALPYIGTVILLPVVMALFAFPLCFIRQFGDAYDVWAVVRPAQTLPPAPPIPPVQENPPLA